MLVVDIPEVTFPIVIELRDSARWTSVFRPERRLRSRNLLELGGSDHEPRRRCAAVALLSTADRPRLPLSFSLDLDVRPAHEPALFTGGSARPFQAPELR